MKYGVPDTKVGPAENVLVAHEYVDVSERLVPVAMIVPGALAELDQI
jgi:hypothetical protein